MLSTKLRDTFWPEYYLKFWDIQVWDTSSCCLLTVLFSDCSKLLQWKKKVWPIFAFMTAKASWLCNHHLAISQPVHIYNSHVIAICMIRNQLVKAE